VQVDPIKPTLKAPGIERLKLIRDDPHSNFGFAFNLRRYNWGADLPPLRHPEGEAPAANPHPAEQVCDGAAGFDAAAAAAAAAVWSSHPSQHH